jgi:hypothetical protein
MKALSILFMGLIVAGCEQVVENPDWPEYVEKGILQAEIVVRDDSTFVYCNFGRTAPLNEPFDFLATRINDARIEFRRGSEAFLVPAIAGNWDPMQGEFHNYALVLETNDTRDFFVRVDWSGKQLEGSVTLQSVKTEADTIIIKPAPAQPNLFVVTFRMHVLPDIDYNMYLFGPNSWTSTSFWVRDIPPEGKIIDEIQYLRKGSWLYTIQAEDRKYRNWYSSNSGDPFEPTGSNPKHNVTGDGIGFLTYRVLGTSHPFEVK